MARITRDSLRRALIKDECMGLFICTKPLAESAFRSSLYLGKYLGKFNVLADEEVHRAPLARGTR